MLLAMGSQIQKHTELLPPWRLSSECSWCSPPPPTMRPALSNYSCAVSKWDWLEGEHLWGIFILWDTCYFSGFGLWLWSSNPWLGLVVLCDLGRLCHRAEPQRSTWEERELPLQPHLLPKGWRNALHQGLNTVLTSKTLRKDSKWD